jgi:hypothetical protein
MKWNAMLDSHSLGAVSGSDSAATRTRRWLDWRFAPPVQGLAVFIFQTRQIPGSQKSL